MSNIVDCNSIEEVRSNIDRIDRQIVTLLAERGGGLTLLSGSSVADVLCVE